jgi:hypothetical protein
MRWKLKLLRSTYVEFVLYSIPPQKRLWTVADLIHNRVLRVQCVSVFSLGKPMPLNTHPSAGRKIMEAEVIEVYLCGRCGAEHPCYQDAEMCCIPEVRCGFYCSNCEMYSGSETLMKEHVSKCGKEKE